MKLVTKGAMSDREVLQHAEATGEECPQAMFCFLCLHRNQGLHQSIDAEVALLEEWTRTAENKKPEYIMFAELCYAQGPSECQSRQNVKRLSPRP